MRIQTKIAIGATVLAAAAIPGSATAGGGNNAEKAEVKVTIKVTQDNTTPNDDVFEGKVKSDRKSCSKPGRTIGLYGGPGGPVDEAELNADGEYILQVANPHQGVFPYKAKIDGNDKCKTGKSKGVSPGSS